jgi:hypothetical protein
LHKQKNLSGETILIIIVSKNTTITISRETRDLLLKLKGKKSWDSFLREMALEEIKKKRQEIREKLQELLELEYEDVRVKRWAREF